MNITILGLGAMGGRMAARLAAAGRSVTGWNRTKRDLPDGVISAASPADAVANADIAVAMLYDDAASSSVWDGPDGALAAMNLGSIAIESSTLTPGRIDAFASSARARGITPVDAPVLGSRPQADAGQLVHLVGGDAEIFEAIRPILAVMSAAQLHAGPVGQGAALKLIANTLFGIQVTAMAELLARARRLGLDPAATIELLGQTPLLSPAAKGAAGLMLAEKDDPMFPVAVVAKDFGYAIDQLDAMPVAKAAANVFARAAETGWGDRNLTAVARLY